MRSAIIDYLNGEGTQKELAAKYAVASGSLSESIQRCRRTIALSAQLVTGVEAPTPVRTKAVPKMPNKLVKPNKPHQKMI